MADDTDSQDALERIIAAAPGIGGGGGGMQGEGVPVPQGSMKLSSPNFLSKKARGVFSWALFGLGGLCLVLGFILIWTYHADSTANWVLPTNMLMLIGGGTVLVAYFTVAGFGNVDVSVGKSSELETGSAALAVSAVDPADGSTEIDPAAAVKATFSAAVDTATVTADAFTLKTAAGSAVDAGVTYDEDTKTATLTPKSALAAATKYQVTVTVDVTDAGGKALTAAKAWTFTTK